MLIRRCVVVFVAIVMLAGCAAQGANTASPALRSGELAWNHKPLVETTAEFHFAIVSDNTGGMRPGVFKDAVAKINLLQPAFVMSVGDFIEGYSEKEEEYRAMFDEFSGVIGGLDAPFFGATGNHDVSNEMVKAYVTKRYGRPYYAFVYKDVLFLVLNTQDNPDNSSYAAGFSDAQVEFAAKTLAANSRVRWTFVFMHQPFFAGGEYAGVKGWDKVEAALAGRPHTVFAGHEHGYAKYMINGNAYYRLATTGGANMLRGADRGEFDEVVWVTMTEDGPTIANLDLSGIYRDDVATDETTRAYSSIDDGTVVKVASPVAQGAEFTSARTKLDVKNDTDFPLTVEATVESSEPLAVEPSHVKVSAKPHTTESADLALSVARPMAPAEIAPAAVNWSASYDVPGRKPIAGTGKGEFLIESIHPCRRAAKPVAIDGDLAEWGELGESFVMPMQFSANASLWTGPADASARFATSYDDKFVYLAFAVTDDRVVVDSEHKPRQEDCLSIYIDARASQARATKAADYSAIFVISPGPASGKEALGEPLPDGASAASVITPTGYNTEIAIPVALLDKAAGGSWKDFRLNVRLHDLDTTQWDATLMWWRPIWFGALDIPGSGTFVRE